MKLIDALEADVMPFVPGCPEPLAVSMMRRAAEDFCRRTSAWRAALAPLAADGTATTFALTIPAGAAVHKLLRVTSQPTDQAPLEALLLEPLEAQRRLDDGDHTLLAFIDTGRTSLAVWPAQPSGASIVATAALKPTLTADELPDAVLNQHGVAIAAGARALLLAMPGKAWANESAAAIDAATYDTSVARAARGVEGGFARSARRPTTRYF